MSDLLEFVLNCLLELLCTVFEGYAGWRFFLSFLCSIGVVVLLEVYGSSWNGSSLAAVLVLLAGVVTGIVWEIRSIAAR